jgi:transposase-like protein
VIVDGKYVKLRGGRKGVLLIALGLTDHGVRAVPEVVLTGEEDLVSYWDLLVRLWRHNLTLVVADGLRPWRRPSPVPGSRSRGRPAWSTSNEAGG